VGLVHWAVARREGKTVARERVFRGDRARIQMLAAYAALSLVRDAARGKLD
jgi:nicotinamide mononucleotide (NMN) deamidase PncC